VATVWEAEFQYTLDLMTVAQWEAQDYALWASEYYEQEVDLSALQRVFAHQINADVVRALNPGTRIDAVAADVVEIGVKVR
jgi:hypothetical protein